MLLEERIFVLVKDVLAQFRSIAWQPSDEQFIKESAVKLAGYQQGATEAQDDDSREQYREMAQYETARLVQILEHRVNAASNAMAKDALQAALTTILPVLL